MKRHWKASNTWLKLKALEYFVNFLRNQRGWIDDDDFFNLVSELLPPEEWKKRICASFSADQIRWLQDRSHSSGLHGRTLDFSDSPQEQFCAI